MQDHIQLCGNDKLVKCMICGEILEKEHFEDHVVAHTIEQREIHSSNLLQVVRQQELSEEAANTI